MASTAIRIGTCDYCHQKPKFAGHSYCSKTCATQAAVTLCVQCHQKPKFANYDYCGKHCAQTAHAQKSTAATKQPAAPPARIQAPQVAYNAPTTKGTVQGNGNQKSVTAPVVASAPQIPAPAPAQKPHTSSWMKNAAAHIPQILSGSNNQSITASKGTTKSQRSTAAVQVPPLTVQTNAAATAVAPASPAVCGIPGCEEYAYVDAAGQQTSDYCSMSHREEAVESGLVSPCIMCLTMPQSNVDHFCGRACREGALSKPF